MKVLRTALAALGVCLLSTSLAHGAIKNGDIIKPFTLTSLDGKEVTVDFSKNKVNVLSFWVSTCSLCKDELKTINGMVDKYKDVGFTVVSTDFGGARIVKIVLKETEVVPKVPLLMDKSAQIAKSYGISRFPFLLILNNEGRVLWYMDGWEADSEERFNQEVQYRLK